MAKKDEPQTDPKEVEKRLKEAKAIAKDIERSKKGLADAAAQLKQLVR